MPHLKEIYEAVENQDEHNLYWALVKWYIETIKDLEPETKIMAMSTGIGSIAENIGLSTDSPNENARLRKKGCSICGYNVFEAMVVHHIDKNRENNSSYNLLPLCRNCHWLVHRDIISITPMKVDRTLGKVNISYQLKR